MHRVRGWVSALILLSAMVTVAQGQASTADIGYDVRVHVVVQGSKPSASEPVVLWLTPMDSKQTVTEPGAGQHFQMEQKNKMFAPHLLIVPTGAVVAFPNRDPFFHNVFSLFDGRRFDLGLYETGVSHTVPFRREGVSYIFCNIHPEMGAVIVAVATPYYTVATQEAGVIRGVPAGDYVLKIFAEDATDDSVARASQVIHVRDGAVDAGQVELTLHPKTEHRNKFGKPYSRNGEGSPY